VLLTTVLLGAAHAEDTVEFVRARHLMGCGAPRQISVRPVRENDLWKIADVSYDNGESLLDYYRRITRP